MTGQPIGIERIRRPLYAGALVAIALLVCGYLWSLGQAQTISGLRIGGQSIGAVPFSKLAPEIDRATRAFLSGKLTLAFGADEVQASRRELGFIVDEKAAAAEAKAAGRSGNPLVDLADRLRSRRGRLDLALPVDIDRARALEFFTNLKDQVDRAAVDARLDLERHTIAPAEPGYLLRVYDSMVALEYAARSGQTRVVLTAAVTPPRVTAAELKDIDISSVLGSWETHYSASAVESDRTYNLKVGADHLNGHILKPHEAFSFNEVVGARTEQEGYRVAPVIQGGELIDGLAGGMCQIASTLHAAAFFAGLDILSSTPHSRPSSYITMGLDSTVVYPTVDLKLRNPYDFPVVMHFQVNQGAVKVELLGKERPYRVVFEREIKSETSFPTETRADPEAPVGQRYPLQEGYPGYSLIRRRYIFDRHAVPRWSGPEPIADLLKKERKHAVAHQQWALHYPPTVNIIAVGTGPRSLKRKVVRPAHHIRPLDPHDKPLFKMIR